MTGDARGEPRPATGALIRPFLAAGVGATAAGTEPAPNRPGLRPFLLTEGRVSADASIAVETQVLTTEQGRGQLDALAFERRAIVELCATPLSVAEIAARLGLHLGVVRVLVADLSTAGVLAAYVPDTDLVHDVDTLVRVIRGLRAIH